MWQKRGLKKPWVTTLILISITLLLFSILLTINCTSVNVSKFSLQLSCSFCSPKTQKGINILANISKLHIVVLWPCSTCSVYSITGRIKLWMWPLYITIYSLSSAVWQAVCVSFREKMQLLSWIPNKDVFVQSCTTLGEEGEVVLQIHF